MKNQNKFILVLICALALGIWKWKSTSLHHGESTEVSEQTSQASQNQTSNQTTLTADAKKPAQNVSQDSAKEKSSLEDMSKTLFQFTRPDSRLGDLVQYLESSQQEPQVARNSNPDTGEMVIVRTRNPLPGTRYFHAQYFSDENQQSFVQHMSFEFKPSPTALNEAVETLQKNFPDLPAPKTRNADFVQWSVPGGYVLWVKKMTAEELKDDPFNAYTADDVGTVRVAVEREIHGDGDDDDHHH
jgi:hypothetical protein